MSDLHVVTYAIDDVDKAGRFSLKPFDNQPETGPDPNARVCHLQCHLGDNSFAVVQLGAAKVVGLDFNPARSPSRCTGRAAGSH